MRIASFSTADDPRVRLGVVDDAGLDIVELHHPADLTQLVVSWDTERSAVAAAAEAGPPMPLETVRLHAPLAPPRNVLCIGKNYRDHVSEMAAATGGSAQPERPIVFTKAPTTVIGPADDIPLHAEVTSMLDYEAELGVVIGRGGRAITEAEAMAHVWGFTVINDVTARDLQFAHGQWFLGKSLDGACPMGPWVVTADAFDLDGAEVRCSVNGEVRQAAPVSQMIFAIPTLIAALSAGMTLVPGDVIATGTPAGVGAAMDPPQFLTAGDEVVCEVTGLGLLRNRVA
ncbi:MAG TPA: fumarylacetoacetate hydrolase family protein [Acidimicrobiales bacterium]|nr:fumarylacetoacetate hydrolase family protein [Acidimicrobiales bacterium]